MSVKNYQGPEGTCLQALVAQTSSTWGPSQVPSTHGPGGSIWAWVLAQAGCEGAVRAGGSAKEEEPKVEDRPCLCPRRTQGGRAERVCWQQPGLGSICPVMAGQVPLAKAHLRSSRAVVSSSRGSRLGTGLPAAQLGQGGWRGPGLKHSSHAGRV